MVAEPSPVFASWADYVSKTSYAERMARCHAASKRANRVHRCQWRLKITGRSFVARMMKEKIKGPCARCGSPPGTTCFGEQRLKGSDIWNLLEQARGRCCYCESLAVENRPSDPKTGAPFPWKHVGRRIGSLEHFKPYYDGRINDLSNLRWACLWCNTWPSERRLHARDHSGFYPVESEDDSNLAFKRPEPAGIVLDSDDDDGFEMYPDHECPWDVGRA